MLLFTIINTNATKPDRAEAAIDPMAIVAIEATAANNTAIYLRSGKAFLVPAHFSDVVGSVCKARADLKLSAEERFIESELRTIARRRELLEASRATEGSTDADK